MMVTLTATPPTTVPLDDGAQHQAYETRTPTAPRPVEDQSLVPLGVALDAMTALGSDWDSYGALPPTRATLQYAWTLTSMLVERGVPLPQVFPTRSGGVQLEWHRPTASLEWEVDSDLSTGVFIFDDVRTGERIDGELPDDFPSLGQALSRISVA